MAADTVVPESNPRDAKRAKHFWTPPPAIGMQGRRHRTWPADVYRGTKAELVAAGLLADGMFPGDPGMPLVSASYRPEGTKYEGWRTPGMCLVIRSNGGSFFRAMVMCSAEERLRREREEVEAEAEASSSPRPACADQRAANERSIHLAQGLIGIIEEFGPEQVMKVAARLHRKANPLRCRANLRLVWSAK